MTQNAPVGAMLPLENVETEARVRLPKSVLVLNAGLMIVGAGALIYYLFAMQWSVVELARVVTGMVALWLPVGSLAYLLLGAEVPDRTTRVTLSAIASYSLTTFAYFAFSVFEAALLDKEAGPHAVVARTRKGHGVSFMEHKMEWHYLPLTEALYRQAIVEVYQ